MEPAAERNGSLPCGTTSSYDAHGRQQGTTNNTNSQSADEVEDIDEAREAQRQRDFVRAIMDSKAVTDLIGVLRTFVEGHPQKAQLDHDLRMRVQSDNATFYASNRKYFLMGLCMCLIFLGVVIWSLRSEKDLLLPVLTAVVSLLAGAGGGFIFGQSRRNSHSDS